MGKSRPQRHIIPDKPRSNADRARELRESEEDLFDAMLCLFEATELRLVRGISFAKVGIGGQVNLILNEDEPVPPEMQWCADCLKIEKGYDRPGLHPGACQQCDALPPYSVRPVIKRFSKMNHYEACMYAGDAVHKQILHLANEAKVPNAQAFIQRLAAIRALRKPRIIDPSESTGGSSRTGVIVP